MIVGSPERCETSRLPRSTSEHNNSHRQNTPACLCRFLQARRSARSGIRACSCSPTASCSRSGPCRPRPTASTRYVHLYDCSHCTNMSCHVYSVRLGVVYVGLDTCNLTRMACFTLHWRLHIPKLISEQRPACRPALEARVRFEFEWAAL